jgi:DNA-directed RNA polymerase specialized sigma24 family protein
MTPFNLSSALEQFDGSDSPASNKACTWLWRCGYCLARRVTHSTADAEDLAQEWVARLTTCRQRLGKAVPAAYAMRVWRNLRADWFKERYRRHSEGGISAPESVSHHDTEEPTQDMDPTSFRASADAYRIECTRRELWLDFEAIRSKSTGTIRKGLDALERLHRLGMTYPELSEAWGMPVGTIKSYVFNASLHLRKELGSK